MNTITNIYKKKTQGKSISNIQNEKYLKKEAFIKMKKKFKHLINLNEREYGSNSVTC